MRRVSSSALQSHDKAWAVGVSVDEPAGKAALPPAPLSLLARLTRRKFLVVSGLLALATLPGCGSSGSSSSSATRFAYRLSSRGRRASSAAKKHNANWLFRTSAAAESNRAHAGDSSRPVRIEISNAFHDLLFGGGTNAADLRRIHG